jgi:hypothetical protein
MTVYYHLLNTLQGFGPKKTKNLLHKLGISLYTKFNELNELKKIELNKELTIINKLEPEDKKKKTNILNLIQLNT